MAETLAYLNGRLVPAQECRLPVYDLGIVIGAAVTDLARTFNRTPYLLEEHVRRLYRSARYARIRPPIPIEECLRTAAGLLENNAGLLPGRELAIIFYLTAGENRIYAGSAGISEQLTPTFVMHTFPLPFEVWRDAFRTGYHCVTPAPRHWPPQCLSSQIKHRNRLHMWIGEQEIHALDPKAVALYLDVDGHITETGGSNFVVYRDGRVVSPRRPNILWGLSLEVLTRILEEFGIPFVEADVHVFDVANADEAWMPSTPYCLAPVTRVNGTPIGDGKPGPVWRRILDRWSAMVSKDIYREIAEAGG